MNLNSNSCNNMYSTLSSGRQQSGYRNQPIRHCPDSSLLTRSNINGLKRLLSDYSEPEMKSILLKQQTQGISEYFACFKVHGVNREADDARLVGQLFDNTRRALDGSSNDDFIVVDKTVLNSQKTHFQYLKFPNCNLKPQAEPKIEVMGFEELLKNRYQAYKRNFHANTDLENGQLLSSSINPEKKQGHLYTSLFEQNRYNLQSSDSGLRGPPLGIVKPMESSFNGSLYSSYTFHSRNEQPLEQSIMVKTQKDTASTVDSYRNMNKSSFYGDSSAEKHLNIRVYSSTCFFERRV